MKEKQALPASLVIFILFPALCFSEITQNYDQTTGKARIVSTYGPTEYFNQVLFFKNSGDSNCTLTFILKQREKVLFSGGNAKFVASSFPLTFMGDSFEDEDKEIIITKASFDASGPTTRYILTSDSITITLNSKNFGQITWVVPYYIIQEWREVIKR